MNHQLRLSTIEAKKRTPSMVQQESRSLTTNKVLAQSQAKLNHSEANNKQRLSTKKIRKTKTVPHIMLLQLQSNARYLAYLWGGGGFYLSLAQSYDQISNENHNENSTLRRKKKQQNQ